MNLAAFPRAMLCQAPLPLDLLPRLTEALGGPQVWMKRDDLTGVGLGGNKIRRLEFLVGDALAKGAVHVQSCAVDCRHRRETWLGLAGGAGAPDRGERQYLFQQRNVLLDPLLGCRLEYRPGGGGMQAAIEEVGA